jgi:hypothetical protein
MLQRPRFLPAEFTNVAAEKHLLVRQSAPKWQFYSLACRELARASCQALGCRGAHSSRGREPWEWDVKRLATHARAGQPALIAGYLGKGDQFDEAVADFATAYAEQNERGYKALVRAARQGRIEVYTES